MSSEPSEPSDAPPEISEPGEAAAEEEATPPAGTGKGRRRALLALLAGALVVVLVAVLVIGGRALDWWASDSEEPAAAPTPEPTESAAPSPFAGTPAEHFAEGADGIVLPPAEPIGDFTAEEVADALDQVKQALIAARLDPAVLIDHDLEVLLRQMAPDQHLPLEDAINGGGYGPFPTFVAQGLELEPVEPRVSGEMSVGTATAGAVDTTVLQVPTRFVWVYAFADGLVVVRDALIWEVMIGRPWAESTRGVWLAEGSSAVWGVDCEAYGEGFLQPDSDAVLEDGNRSEVIFDPILPVQGEGGC